MDDFGITSRIASRPVVQSDIDLLTGLDLSTGSTYAWRHAGAWPSPAARLAGQWGSVLDQRLLYRRSDGQVLGYGTVYDHNPRASTAWLAFVASEQARQARLGFVVAGLYVTQVFAEWPLRYLYCDTRGGSATALSPIVDDDAVVECGRFPGEAVDLRNGTSDVVWLAIERGTWAERYGETFR